MTRLGETFLVPQDGVEVHTIRAGRQVDNISNTNVDYSEESLVLFLKLLLIEHLDR
jgi:hypothetical protein